MEKGSCPKQKAEAANARFDKEMRKFLKYWVGANDAMPLLKFDQSLNEYLSNNALRDFFLYTPNPLQKLLKKSLVSHHLGRRIEEVYFDPISSDPLLSLFEQRIYNLARRIDLEKVHVPFRSIDPKKQTDAGDCADVALYPTGCDYIRYNSGNHFASRPANGNVFNENSKRCSVTATKHLHVMYKRGFLEDRLQEMREITTQLHDLDVTEHQFFVICSRHSKEEGHFGTSLIVMNPMYPDFPERVLVSDTLLKDLPHHPRWWPHFINEYTNVFGEAVTEIIQDISHPLQKVNVRGDDPYRNDWDCPYYATSATESLINLVKEDAHLALSGTVDEIHNGMKQRMQDYYENDLKIRNRADIQKVNRLKRWNSGRLVIKDLVGEAGRKSACEL